MLITLTTDFGTADAYVAQMKGVIESIAPGTSVIDISHDVPAQDVVAGALMLEHTLAAFPEGTIHVGVIDPGGLGRHPEAAQRVRARVELAAVVVHRLDPVAQGVAAGLGAETRVWGSRPPGARSHPCAGSREPALHLGCGGSEYGEGVKVRGWRSSGICGRA